MAVILMFPGGARRARRGGRGMTHDVFAAQEELERSHRAAQLAAFWATGTTALVMVVLHVLGS